MSNHSNNHATFSILELNEKRDEFQNLGSKNMIYLWPNTKNRLIKSEKKIVKLKVSQTEMELALVGVLYEGRDKKINIKLSKFQ